MPSPRYTLGRDDIAKHTPTPWRVHHTHVYRSGKHSANICSVSDPRAEGEIVEYIPATYDSRGLEEAVANAEFITRACNTHDDLVAACRELLDAGRDVTAKASDRDACDAAINRLVAAEHAADAALAKAEGR